MIVCFGSINLDLIFPVAHLPTPGKTVLGEALHIDPGGKGANQAVAAARDGARVVFAGAVGRDALAALALRGVEAAGVDISRVREAEGATGAAAICVDRQGRNQIAVAPGANRYATHDQVEDALLGPGTTLLVQMEVPAAQTAALIRRAHAAGARVLLNLAPAAPLDEDALRLADVLVANSQEAAWLGSVLGTGVHAPSLHGALGCVVVVTEGADGLEFAARDGGGRMPAAEIEAVDTTAAGDCFTGVLAAALDRGLALEPALRRANAAAGLCCLRRGTQGSLPSAAEIDAA